MAIRRLVAILMFGVMVVGAGASLAAPTKKQTATIEKANLLLKQGNAEGAFKLLEPLEFDLAGDVDYDYAFGIAALDSGRPDVATLVFERVLAVKPKFAGARLDLARAYFSLGDDVKARTEFDKILEQSPPPHVRALVDKYVVAIEQRAEAKLTKYTAYGALTVGYDSNVNNSTSSSTVYVPIFNANLVLSASNVQAGDSYNTWAVGGTVTHQLRPGLGVYAGIDAKTHHLWQEHNFENDSLDVNGGFSFTDGGDTYKVGVVGGLFWLANQENRRSFGYNASWQRIWNSRNITTLFGQYSEMRYPNSALSSNNINQALAGASWIHSLNDDASKLLFASVYGGRESDPDGRADGVKNFLGFNYGGQSALRDDLSFYASFGLQYGDYDKVNVSFRKQRQDTVFTLKGGFNWVPAKDWSVISEVGFTDNHSEIALYKYTRTDASVTIRRDFR